MEHELTNTSDLVGPPCPSYTGILVRSDTPLAQIAQAARLAWLSILAVQSHYGAERFCMVRNSAATMYHNLSDDELFREARRMHDVPIIEELIKRIEGLQTRIYDLETLTNEEEGNVT